MPRDEDPDYSLALQIGERIHELMRARKLTTSQVATAIGVTPDAVAKMTKGQGTAQFAKLARLATVLGSTPNEILKFGRDLDSDVFVGIIEGILTALDRHPEEIAAIAGIAKRILRDGATAAKQWGKSIADFLTREYLSGSKKQSGHGEF